MPSTRNETAGQMTTPLDNSGVDKDGNPLPTGAFTPRTDRTVIAPDALNKTPIDPSRLFPGVQIQARIASDPTGEAVHFLSRPTPRFTIHVKRNYPGHYPNWLHIHLMLAAVYSELGQAAEAQKEAAEVLRLNSNFSLEVHKQRMPIKDPAVLERHITALRKAGLK